MKIVPNMVQGSDSWRELRAKRFTASEAPAMMRASKYMTRDELIRQKATGEIPEVDAAKQAIFNRGHAAEAAARPLAEAIVGEDLYPCTCEDDEGWLLASMDGLDLEGLVGFEHKLINNDLRQATAETLDDHYKIQMDQQLLVTGAEKILFMASDGTKDDCVWFWYERDEDRIAELIEGWRQFEVDLSNYEHKAPKPEVVADEVETLPAVYMRAQGAVAVTHNFEDFELRLTNFLDNKFIRKPKSDADFATLDLQIKAMKESEAMLQSAGDSVIAEIQEVDRAIRKKNSLYELVRQNRLMAEKLLDAEKKSRKMEIAQEAKRQFDEHIRTLNQTLDGDWMPHVPTDFNAAMKNKRTIATLESAANDELARARIEANRIASRIEANLNLMREIASEHKFLFNDIQQLVTKDREALEAIAKQRIAEHDAAEKAKREAEAQRIADAKIKEAEEAKAKEEASRLAAHQAAEQKPEGTAAPGSASQTTISTEGGAVQVASFAQEVDPPWSYDEMMERTAGPTTNQNIHSIPDRRPPDDRIIEVLALHYRVHESKVIEWLLSIDLEAAGKRMAANP